jgi:malate synthase
MAAFIPNRRDTEVTERALAKVREDKEREAGDGFDGTWVAHPDLVPVATEIFDAKLGERQNQLEVMREDVAVDAADLLDVASTGGSVTEAGIRTNVNVGVRYIASWLTGTGAAAIDNLMEDAATAETATQVWQDPPRRPHGRRPRGDGRPGGCHPERGDGPTARPWGRLARVPEARELFERVALSRSSWSS